MGKFKFRFATVLKLRQSVEENALRTLGAAQRAYQAELVKKARLLSDLSEALDRREALGVEPIGVREFQLEQLHITGTKQRIVQQDQALIRASRAVEKQLRVYLHAKRQTRTIELLRDRDFIEFKHASAKKEQKELDELSVMRARLKPKEDEETA